MGEILAALLGDAIRIWMSLLLFVILGLYGVPSFFNVIPNLLLQISSFSVYVLSQFTEEILPAPERLDKLEEALYEQIYHHHDSLKQKPYKHWKHNRLEKVLYIIGNFIAHPSTLKKRFKNDYDLSGDPACTIKFKFKTLFFGLATLASISVIVLPAFGITSLSFLASALSSWGIATAFANFGAVVLVGGFIYSLRAPAIGLVLAINSILDSYYKLFDRNDGYVPLDTVPSSQRSSSAEILTRIPRRGCSEFCSKEEREQVHFKAKNNKARKNIYSFWLDNINLDNSTFAQGIKPSTDFLRSKSHGE